jgi:hypothetical protein
MVVGTSLKLKSFVFGNKLVGRKIMATQKNQDQESNTNRAYTDAELQDKANHFLDAIQRRDEYMCVDEEKFEELNTEAEAHLPKGATPEDMKYFNKLINPPYTP